MAWIGVLWLDGFPFSRCKSQGFFKSSSQQSKQPANGYLKLGSTSWKSPKPSPKEYLTTPPPFWGRLGLHVSETPCLGDGTVASRPDGLGGGGVRSIPWMKKHTAKTCLLQPGNQASTAVRTLSARIHKVVLRKACEVGFGLSN